MRERKSSMNSVAPYSAWPLPTDRQLPAPAYPRAASEPMYASPAPPSLELNGRETKDITAWDGKRRG